jgi:hypothetical protein
VRLRARVERFKSALPTDASSKARRRLTVAFGSPEAPSGRAQRSVFDNPDEQRHPAQIDFLGHRSIPRTAEFQIAIYRSARACTIFRRNWSGTRNDNVSAFLAKRKPVFKGK